MIVSRSSAARSVRRSSGMILCFKVDWFYSYWARLLAQTKQTVRGSRVWTIKIYDSQGNTLNVR